MAEEDSSTVQPKGISKLNIFFVIVFIIAAFVIGTLWTKVQYLEKGASTDNKQTTTGTNKAANNVPVNPTQKPPSQKPKFMGDDRVRGNRNANVTLIEYSDYECPFCKQFHPTMNRIIKEYGDSVKLIFRDFPLSFHKNAQKEAEAGWCINELGGIDAFWSYTDTVFERTTSNGTGFPLEKLGPLAKELGVDQQKFQACLDSGKYSQKVQDLSLSGVSEGVTGTPGTLIIDGKGNVQLVAGAIPYEQFKPMIEAALKN